MFLFFYEAKSRPAAALAPREDADVYCWVRDGDFDAAESAAVRLIEAAGWEPSECLDVRRVERADYEGGPAEPLYYFDDAVLNGSTLLVWRHDDSRARCPIHDAPI